MLGARTHQSNITMSGRVFLFQWADAITIPEASQEQRLPEQNRGAVAGVGRMLCFHSSRWVGVTVCVNGHSVIIRDLAGRGKGRNVKKSLGRCHALLSDILVSPERRVEKRRLTKLADKAVEQILPLRRGQYV